MVRAFCVVGRHPSDEATGESPNEHQVLPDGWRLVRASFIDGSWILDPSSGASIVCCPTHSVV